MLDQGGVRGERGAGASHNAAALGLRRVVRCGPVKLKLKLYSLPECQTRCEAVRPVSARA